MRSFEHPALTGPFFRLLDVVEVDVRVGDRSWTWRLELLGAVGHPGLFRYRAWDLELFRLAPTFPRGDDGLPLEQTDDELFAHRPLPRQTGHPLAFEAASQEAALALAVDDLRASLEHVTGLPAAK
jgi:hypothetical protein